MTCFLDQTWLKTPSAKQEPAQPYVLGVDDGFLTLLQHRKVDFLDAGNCFTITTVEDALRPSSCWPSRLVIGTSRALDSLSIPPSLAVDSLRILSLISRADNERGAFNVEIWKSNLNIKDLSVEFYSLHAPLLSCPKFSLSLLLGCREFPVLVDGQVGWDGLDINTLPSNAHSELCQFAGALASFLDTIGAREEFFALGPTSRLAAKMTASITAQNRLGKTQPLSVILIDRTLDVITPILHRDSILDAICANDAAPKWNWQASHLKEILELFLFEPSKTALVQFRKSLTELVEKLGLDVSMPKILGKVSVSHLTKLKNGLLSLPETKLVEYGEVVEFIDCVIGTLDDTVIQSLEKVIMASIAESKSGQVAASEAKENIITQIRSLLDAKDGHEVDSILGLVTVVYLLLGGGRSESTEETLLIAGMMKTFVRGGIVNAEQKIDRFFKSLDKLSANSSLKRYGNLWDSKVGTFVPLLARLMQDVFDPNGREMEDLVSVPSSQHHQLGQYLSGVGRMLASSVSRPAQASVIVICVLGGITFDEVRLIKSSLEKYSKYHQVHVVTSSFCNAKGTVEKL